MWSDYKNIQTDVSMNTTTYIFPRPKNVFQAWNHAQLRRKRA